MIRNVSCMRSSSSGKRCCRVYARSRGDHLGGFRKALTLAEAFGMRPLQGHCQHGLGMLHAGTGQAKQARAELAAAIAIYHDMDMIFWLPQAKAALAQVQ